MLVDAVERLDRVPGLDLVCVENAEVLLLLTVEMEARDRLAVVVVSRTAK